MCPNCFTKNMRRQGRKSDGVCRDCGTVFARPIENEQNSRKMEATAAHRFKGRGRVGSCPTHSARTIPFGYEADDNDPDILLPVATELDLLETARKHVKQYSYREVANWLSANSGRYISHVGLRKRLAHERQRKNQAASLRKWAEYAEKAIAKAQEIEETRLGAKRKKATA